MFVNPKKISKDKDIADTEYLTVENGTPKYKKSKPHRFSEKDLNFLLPLYQSTNVFSDRS